MVKTPYRQRAFVAWGLAQACITMAAHAQDEPAAKALDIAVLRHQAEAAVQLAGGLKVTANKSALREGELLELTIEIPRAGYLNVVSIDPAGTPTVLLPNRVQADNRVEAGRFTLPGPQMQFELRSGAPFGSSLVTAFLTADKIDLAEVGALQSHFAHLSNVGRDLIDALGTKALMAEPSGSPVLAGMVTVVACAKTGPCEGAAAPEAAPSSAAPASGGLAARVRDVLDALTPGILLEVSDKSYRSRQGPLRAIYGKGIRLVKVSEGFVPFPYNDAGHLCSVAYGHLIKRMPCDGTELPRFRRGLPESEGAKLLAGDMALAQRAVMSLVSVDLTDGQFAALCDFTYNVGAGNLKRSTLLKAVNAREDARVPSQLRRWVNAGGKPQRGLRTRRERELALFFEGQAIPKASPAPGDGDTAIDIRSGEPGS